MIYANDSSFIITSSRLQPIHLGHILFWHHIVNNYNKILLVCIIRNANTCQVVNKINDPYVRSSEWTQELSNNPLPDFERLMLANAAVSSDSVLFKKTILLLRTPPSISWEDSIKDLPKQRMWIFNETKSQFDASKAPFYRDKGENVTTVDLGDFGWSGKSIRERLREGDSDLSFLPHGCTELFSTFCLPYFTIKDKST